MTDTSETIALPDTDVAWIENGSVAQIVRNVTKASLAAQGIAGDLVEFPRGQAICGMFWDGTTLTIPSPPAPSQDDYKNAIQALIDRTAQNRNYTNGDSVAKYALLPANPPGFLWKEEAAAFVQWVADVWAYAFAQLAAVQSGARSQPTVDALMMEIAAAHPMNWPD